MPTARRPFPGDAVVAALLPLALGACDGADAGAADTFTVTDSAGVALVEQTLDPARRLTLDEVWRVGSLDGDDATQFFTPRDAVLGDDGQVYLLDSGNNRVKVFDTADGRYLYGFGSEGEGPGEFQRMAGQMIGGDGVLVVGDSGQRFHAFRTDGTLIGTVAAGPLLPAGHIATAAAFDGQRFLLQASRYFDVESRSAVPGQPTALLALDFEDGTIGDSTGLTWAGDRERAVDPALGYAVFPIIQ